MKNIFLTTLSKLFLPSSAKGLPLFPLSNPWQNQKLLGNFFFLVSIVVSWIWSLPDSTEPVCAVRGSAGRVGWRLRAGRRQAANKSFPNESSAVDAKCLWDAEKPLCCWTQLRDCSIPASVYELSRHWRFLWHFKSTRHLSFFSSSDPIWFGKRI